jgi:hypothetical protein
VAAKNPKIARTATTAKAAKEAVLYQAEIL